MDVPAGLNQIPNELLVRVFGYLERMSQFRLRRTCLRWDSLLRSFRILAVAKLDMGVLLDLKKFQDGWENQARYGGEQIVLVAESPGKLLVDPESFVWRFGWFLRSQAECAHTLIFEGVKIPYFTFVGIMYLDFRAGLNLVIRNSCVLQVRYTCHDFDRSVHHGEAPAVDCRCVDCLKITNFASRFPGDGRYGLTPGRGLSGCLLDHILGTFLSDNPSWEWILGNHKLCTCEYPVRHGPKEENLKRIRGVTKLRVAVAASPVPKIIQLDVNLAAKVRDVYELPYDVEGIFPGLRFVHGFKLAFGGTQLDSKRTLLEYGIKESDSLELRIPVREGWLVSEILPKYVRVPGLKTITLTYPEVGSGGYKSIGSPVLVQPGKDQRKRRCPR